MRCLVVGTDKLGAAPKVLKEKYSVEKIIHWDGRNKKIPKKLPDKISLVVIYTSFVNHNLMWVVKKLAKKRNIRILFVNRGLAELAS